MTITEQDIKLLKAARMTDTPDGGGRMTGNVVQSGVDNNIFDDVSNLDRVYGNVSLRKVFPAVLTTNTDKYLGARVIIDEPPADDYIEGTLFGASSLFDTRDAAKQRVEAYLATGAPYLGLLYGPHIEGMMVLSLIQHPTREIPAIGDVLILKKNIGLINETEQFVRITGVSAADATFTDANGDYTRTVVSCNISDPLRTDFAGFEAARTDSDLDYTNRSRVFYSVVANAAQYYGIRPLEVAAQVGAFNIKADSSYSQLLPSAQIETPVADANAAGYANAAVSVGDEFTLNTSITFSTTQQIFLGGSILPGSLSITVPGWSTAITENAKGALLYGALEIGSVDYSNGIATLLNNAYAVAGAVAIKYRVSAIPEATMQSVSINVTLAGRSLTYVQPLLPNIAVNSTIISYMAEGKWYVLRDQGDGTLAGLSSGQGAGAVNYDTGTVTVTLGALPDVGSDIIFQWAQKSAAISLGSTDLKGGNVFFYEYQHPAGSNVVPGADITVLYNPTSGPVESITLTNGTTVVNSGDGGIIDPEVRNGVIRIGFNTPPPAATAISVAARVTTYAAITAAPLLAGSVGAAVAPRSFTLLNVAFSAVFTVSGSLNGSDLRMNALPAPWVGNRADDALSWAGLITANVYDDGAGALVAYVPGYVAADWRVTYAKVPVGTINYTTGAYSVNTSVAYPSGAVGPILTARIGAGWEQIPWLAVPAAQRTVTLSTVAQQVQGGFLNAGGTVQNTTFTPTTRKVRLSAPISGGRLLRNVELKTQTGQRFVQSRVDPSKLVTDVNLLTGLGTEVGTIDVATGEITVNSVGTPTDNNNVITSVAAGLIRPSDASVEGNPYVSNTIVFRTPAAPLRPGSFSVLGTLADGTTFNLSADSNGKIETAKVVGYVNYQTGVCVLHAVQPDANKYAYSYGWQPYMSALFGYPNIRMSPEVGFMLSSVRYNAVTYTYLPLDADILGLDPVRLPSDGRVPVFKGGRVVVVHNTQKLAPQNVSNGQTVNCGRTLLARIRVFGNDGLEIASGFSKNLDAGTISFTNIAGMAQPVTIEHRIEDEALCADAQITGDLRLSRPITHNYPANTSYVSSAYIAGTLQAGAQDAYSQETWTSVWSDTRIGNPILAQYDDTINPLVVTNAGAITERWALIFQTNTTFIVVGENVGQIITGDTATPLAPVNPATGVPYFTLQPAGWGAGWVAGNVLRFNTSGANFPLWVARTVRQSPSAAPGTDQMTISIRGDIDQ